MLKKHGKIKFKEIIIILFYNMYGTFEKIIETSSDESEETDD